MNEMSNEAIVDEFLNYIRFFKIAHHVNGRIRVKAAWRSAKELQHIDRDQVERIIAQINGITDYRVNLRALSVVIEYNPSILPYSLWEELGSLEGYPLKRDEIRMKLLTHLE
ncbi:MAG: hypothetical protein COA36_09640 [Desulfotalea sp.]|nr:MAG: hypothetical protein COA36_09640 [Desulfotalea sp.]